MSDNSTVLWHTVPLHYLPYLLETGTLLSATKLAAENHPIRPRPTALRRKTKLGLADYVHLSPASITPLLADKRKKGYPHVLISFVRADVLALPSVALLKFNTKRWAHRDEFLPVMDAALQQVIWNEYTAGKYPSLEVLVPSRLPLGYASCIYFPTEAEAKIFQRFPLLKAKTVPPLQIAPLLFPKTETPPQLEEVSDYAETCYASRAILPPPMLPFD